MGCRLFRVDGDYYFESVPRMIGTVSAVGSLSIVLAISKAGLEYLCLLVVCLAFS